MRPFVYQRADAPEAAILAARPAGTEAKPPTEAATQFIAGGTNILDLMKLDVMRPGTLVNVKQLPAEIAMSDAGLRLSGAVRMAQAAEDDNVRRDFPVIADSLKLAASQQIRNMATLGGNVLQRTRCAYFRDVTFAQCNKRNPGLGCAALDGHNRTHAILGTSDACIATYAGDFAQALIALDAQVEIAGPSGARAIPFAELHREPGDTPHIETVLKPGELITGFMVPNGAWTRRSLYLKVRDRQSYAFATASAAVALDLDGGTVREARIALGGVATKPWRAREAEAALRGKILDEAGANAAAEAAFRDVRTFEHNAFKADLGKRTLVRALLDAARMEIPA
ncbi:FAD binding domain-containing protein [Terrihabitans sp. B22-R8]|uniref:FAD binding domain-containing protein n=1 Tax=Terrihabitans sp. B22-R8 TaxID=3425128 RepID=UPI00403D0284